MDSKKIAGQVHDLQRRHESKLLYPLLKYLRNRSDLRVLGSTSVEGRVPTVAIDLKERGRHLAVRLSQDGILADCGDFCYFLVKNLFDLETNIVPLGLSKL